MCLDVVTTMLHPGSSRVALPLTLSASQTAALHLLPSALMYAPLPEQFVKWFPYHMVVDSGGGIVQVGVVF